jgi:hypothetical protein
MISNFIWRAAIQAVGLVVFALASVTTLAGTCIFSVLYGSCLFGFMVLDWACTLYSGLFWGWWQATTIDNRLVKGANLTYKIESRAADTDRARNLYENYEEEREWCFVMHTSENLFSLLETYKSNDIREFRILRVKMTANI